MVYYYHQTEEQAAESGRWPGEGSRQQTGEDGPGKERGRRMREMMSMEGSKVVPLAPFAHQVGGHTPMLRYSSTTICKVLNAREHFVYESMPDELRVFTAQYRGVMDVFMHQEEDGNFRLLGVPTSRPKDTVEPPESEPEPETLQNESLEDQLKEDEGSTSPPKSPEPQELGESSKSDSPLRWESNFDWNIKLLKKQLDKVKERDGKCQFILLENVGARFRCPSVLDLKMGTRQHGDDTTEEKVVVFTQRCQNSTSSTLGVRVCGMQVYQLTTGQYLTQDKYYGRKLDVEGFEQALRRFLDNGYGLRRDLLPCIIDQIRQLHTVVARQDALRFYSSSLLIMYEGDEASCQGSQQKTSHDSTVSDPDRASDEECPVVVRMIDFAHSTIGGYYSDKEHSGPDRGYLHGLDSLIKAFTKILNDPPS